MSWTVSDVMTHDVVTVGPKETFKACADLMRIHGVSALPVLVAGGRVVGIVSEADLMRTLARQPDEAGAPAADPSARLIAADLMTGDVAFIHPGATVAEAARMMLARHVKRMPVVDASNNLVGIVSRSDILRVFLRSDESIRRELDHGLLNELPLLGRGRVQVDVNDGVVRLLGEVESGSLAGLLVRLVAAVPGVVGVENKLRTSLAPRDAPMALAVGGERRA